MEENQTEQTDYSRQRWLGILVSNLLAAVSMGVLVYFWKTEESPAGVKGFTSVFFTLLQTLMGFICAWYWKGTGMRTLQRMGWTSINTICALAVSAIFAGEGVICLLIVSPLIYVFMLIGVLLGNYLFRTRDNRLNISVASVFMLYLLIDLFSAHHFEAMVSDKVRVQASPETVWKYVAAYEPITRKPDYWLFRIGMPHPVNSTVTVYRKEGGRKCVFSNGYTFDEVMKVYEPGKELLFEITNQPRDPEIMGHIDILKGQFLLKDNGDGSTTLTGNSWYRLYVFPAWYYNLWAQSITRNVHMEVMQQIKRLSEQPQP